MTFVRAKADSAYGLGMYWSATDMTALDNNTTNAVNGDFGGTYSIAGSGLIINGPEFLLHAPLILDGGQVNHSGVGGASTTFGELSATDYFKLPTNHAGFSQTRYEPIQEAATVPGLWEYNNTYGGLVARTIGQRLSVPLRVHDMAQLFAVGFIFRIGSAHGVLPDQLPRFRVVRVSSTGLVQPLKATDAVTDLNGFTPLPRPALAADYYAAGAQKQYTYSPTVNYIVDRKEYTYFAEIVDESGNNSMIGNCFIAIGTTHYHSYLRPE